MSFRHGKDAVFQLGSVSSPSSLEDISGVLTEAALAGSTDTVETTTFQAGNKTYLTGFPDFTINLTGFVDDQGIAAQLADLVNAATEVDFEFGPAGTSAGSPKYTGTVLVSSYSPTASIGGAVSFTASTVAAGSVVYASYS